MLQSMRHLAHSWVVKGLMLFLIISFSVWGIGDIFRGNPLQKTVAKVGNTDISVQELNHLFERSLAQARQKFAPELTAQQAKQMGLLDKTLDNEIKRDLVDQDIKRLGIEVSPKAVLALLADQPQFRMKDGSFNKGLFQQVLDQQHLTENSFISGGQQDLSRQLLVSALGGSHDAPQIVVDAVYKARAQKRILDVVTIDASRMGGIPTPDDKALHEFYASNGGLFTAPEYRGLTVATLSADALAKDITISDEQVKKEYESKSDELSHPEQRDIVQVVMQDEGKAKQLAAQARASGDLSAAAKEAKESAVPLNQMEEKGLLPELAKAVFALSANGISDPVKTQLGWHVVQVKKITPPGKPDFDSVKNKLRDDMRHDQAIEAATRIVNQLDDELAAGHSLDDIADGLKLRLIKIPAVDVSGMTPDGKKPTELPNKEEAIKDAFAQNSGETSPIEDDKAGNYYVVRTDEITPSAVKPFDAVRTSVIAAWKAREQASKARTEAEKIAKLLGEGKALDSVANEEGVSTRSSTPLSQLGDTDALLPPALVTQAFRLKKGETARDSADNKEIVVRLASIMDADMSKPDPRRSKIENEIKKNASDELLSQYVDHLRDVFPVKTNAALLDHLRQQDN